MRTMRGIFGLTLVVVALALTVACAGPNRAECKKACLKFQQCDVQLKVENSIYNDTFVDNCQRSCDAADEIDEHLAKCIVKAQCSCTAGDTNCTDVLDCHPGN